MIKGEKEILDWEIGKRDSGFGIGEKENGIGE